MASLHAQRQKSVRVSGKIKSLQNKQSHTLKRVARVFGPYKIQVALVLITILLITLLGLINPLLVRVIFDDAIGGHKAGLLLLLVSIMVIVPVLGALLGVGQMYLSSLVGQRVMRDLRSELYHHLQSMSLHFFTSIRTGEIQSRISNDVGGAQSVVTDVATRLLTNIAIVLGTIIAMIYISPLLTAISLGIMPFFIWSTYRIGRVNRLLRRESQQSLANLTSLLQETLSVSGILLTKSFGRQAYTQEQFEAENQKFMNLNVKQQLVGRWFFMCVDIVFSIAPAIIYLVAGLQIIHGSLITVGGTIAFTTLQARLFSPIRQLLNAQVEIQGAAALFDRIFEYCDLPVDIQDAPDAIRLLPENVRGHVSFKDVSFAYIHKELLAGKQSEQNGENEQLAVETSACEGEQRRGKTFHKTILTRLFSPHAQESEQEKRATLRNISFDIQPGQLVALVGPSGAGKTTITYLLLRLYDVDRGAVEIDSLPIKDIALASLSDIIGVVTQEAYLLHTSIRRNLLYGRPGATEQEMIAAAKMAAIHDRIMELEDGYDTIVGERGYKLSGGEKQRITIARVILKNPRILILDEATSALDTHAERLIQAALEPLMEKCTTLAIAHRLSTILAADAILVVDKGEIVERGTHDELLERSGFYARLYYEQFEHQFKQRDEPA